MIDEIRLKDAIKEAFEAEWDEEKDHQESVKRLSAAIAAAVIKEIKSINIIYNNGLIAPSNGGPVGGTFNYTLK